MSWRFRIFSGVLLLLSALVSWRAGAQHAVGPAAFEAAAGDAKRLQLAPGLKLDVWAAEPQLSNSVAFAFDGKGRVYLAESDRWAISVFDITAHTNWLWQDMSFRNVSERGAFLTNQFATNLAFLTKDSEVVRRVEDRDGDGRADHTEILATGFTNAVDGTAAGILATREGIYFANIPSLWKLDWQSVERPPSPRPFPPGRGGNATRPSGNESVRPAAKSSPSLDNPSLSSPRSLSDAGTRPNVPPSPGGEGRGEGGPPSRSADSPFPARTALATGFGVHIGVSGHDLHGLIKGPDGRIYMSFGDRGCVLTNREGVVINLPDTGGVLRCEPDGRDLEVFCYGLRNPQELAFDDFGNLWTVDNDTAGADPCRVLYLVEGGDYGWRTSYQHMDGFGPWVQEELWKGGQDGILPPAGTVSQGPSGLAFYPGTGFGERLAGTFLHADFPGGVWAYTVKPQGASYVVDRKEKFLWNCWPTDVDFGPDGAAYVLDWVSGWGQTPRGRIYRITPNDVAAEVTRRTGSDAAGESASSRRRLPESELIAQVKRLLAEGMTQRGEKELLDLLGHADRRVRLEAQWELAERGTNSIPGLTMLAISEKSRFARLHALWAIEQIFRATPFSPITDNEQVRPLLKLIPLLNDVDSEVQTTAITGIGNLTFINAYKPLVPLLSHPEARVRVAALNTLSKLFNPRHRHRIFVPSWTLFRQQAAQLADRVIGDSSAREPIDHWAEKEFERPNWLEVIRPLLSNPTDDFTLHALTDLLAREAVHLDGIHQSEFNELLAPWARSSSQLAKQAAVLAARQIKTSAITNFLSDPDPRLIIAAGRAIHDVPIVEGFPALASFITKIDCPTNLMSRVINACYRLGTQQHAQMLAGFAAREDVPDWARVLALRALADWEKPSPLDRVNGLWRPLKVGQAASLPAAPVSAPAQQAAQPDSVSTPASPSPRPSPLGRGGNADSPSGNEAVQVGPTPSPSAKNPSLTPVFVLSDSSARPTASPSSGGEGRGEGGPASRSAVPNVGQAASLPATAADSIRSTAINDTGAGWQPALLQRAAQAQAARNFGRAAEIPVLPADLGRSVAFEEAMALRRNPAPAQRAFLRVAGDLMNPFNLNEAGQPAGTREVLPLQIAVAEAAAKLHVKEASTPLFEKFAHTNTAPELRRAILPALAELRSALTGDAVKLALADPDPKLRAVALPYLDRLDSGEDTVELLVSLIDGPPSPRPSPPGRGGNAVSSSGDDTVQAAATRLSSPGNPTLPSARVPADSSTRANAAPSPGGEGRGEGGRPADIPLAQAAVNALAKLGGAKADQAVRGLLAQLEAGQLPRELAVDVREAAQARGLASQRAALPELLVGGNAERGRQVFFGNQTVQCLRCHKVGPDGGIVGPDLTGIGKRQSRDYLLESILQPNAKIAAGFENVVLTLADGSTVAGALKSETNAELAIEVTGEDGLPTVTKVAKSAVKQRERGPSAMPEGLGDQLTTFELRDVIEYLATLK